MTDQWEEQFTAGLDLGKLSDYSAFALFHRRRPALQPRQVKIESGAMGRQTVTTVRPPFTGTLTREEKRQRQWSYRLAKMVRWQLGTSYDAILEWLVKAYSRPVDRGGLAGTTLAVDYTGVGVPVVEWLRKEMRLGIKDVGVAKAVIRPIWITAGHRAIENDAGGWNVPKKDLVSILQVLMGTGRLTVEQQMENCGVLVEEFHNFKVKQNPVTGHESFEAWRERDHDDLVLACAVGLWTAEHGQKEMWVA